MESTQLIFFLAPGEVSRPGASLERVEARLPGGRGGLRPLFRAFGLDEGLEAGEAGSARLTNEIMNKIDEGPEADDR